MKFARIYLTALLGLGISSFVAGCNGAPQAPLDQANSHFLRGEADEAIAICSELIEKNDKDIAALILRASAYNGKGEYQKAVADLDRVLTLNVANEQALMLRSYAHRGLGQHEKAMADDAQLRKGQSYKEAFANNPDTLTPLPELRKLEPESLDAEEKKRAHRAALEDAANPLKALTKKPEQPSDLAKENSDVDPPADDQPLLPGELPIDPIKPSEVGKPRDPASTADTFKTPGNTDIKEMYQKLTRPRQPGATSGINDLMEDWKQQENLVGPKPASELPLGPQPDSPLFDTPTDRLLKQFRTPKGAESAASKDSADKPSRFPTDADLSGTSKPGLEPATRTGIDPYSPRTPLNPAKRSEGYADGQRPDANPRGEPARPVISTALPMSTSGQIDPYSLLRPTAPAGMKPTGASPGISTSLPISPSFGLGQGSSITGYSGLGISPTGGRPGQGVAGAGVTGLGVTGNGLMPAGQGAGRFGPGNFNGLGPTLPHHTASPSGTSQPSFSSALPGSNTGSQPGSSALPNYVVPYQQNPGRGTGYGPNR